MKQDNQITIYETEDGKARIEVCFENENVWLTQKQMGELFDTTSQNITQHLKNIYAEGEAEQAATCKDFLQVQQEGNSRGNLGSSKSGRRTRAEFRTRSLLPLLKRSTRHSARSRTKGISPISIKSWKRPGGSKRKSHQRIKLKRKISEVLICVSMGGNRK
jgi:hypothetical protein